MQVSSRARLAWANRNIEAAADIIVAAWLSELAYKLGANQIDGYDLLDEADLLDPERLS